MNEALKLKKKYKTARDKLFNSLIINNDGFIFNNHHTKLVDDVVRDIVKNIIKEYSIDDFALIAVGGMEEMTYHQKVMLICYSFIKNLIKILKILLLP